MLVTSRLVSPNLSAMSHTGTLFELMKLPEWITGLSGVPDAMPNGRMSSACACTTELTSGYASMIAAWMKRSR